MSRSFQFPSSQQQFLALGLMSGTSCDGIDAALCRIDLRQDGRVGVELIEHHHQPYDARMRKGLLLVGGQAQVEALMISRLNMDLGLAFAEAAEAVLRKSGVEPEAVDVIGSHGHTVAHEPPTALGGDRPPLIGATLQLGEAAVLVERLGIPVVSNFRARDMAAGGQGAPLVPYFDQLYFADPDRNRAALNIGGIANITYIPALKRQAPVLAFDTGPGNMLIDGLMRGFTKGVEHFDRDGQRAAAGQVAPKLMELLLRNPYFDEPPPKSTGRELFGEEMLNVIRGKGRVMGLSENDMIRTATEFTVEAIGLAFERFLEPRGGVEELIVSGGGARNPVLMERLQARLPQVRLCSSDAFGLRIDAKEALAFALFACETLRGHPANQPTATGATGPRILGQLTY